MKEKALKVSYNSSVWKKIILWRVYNCFEDAYCQRNKKIRQILDLGADNSAKEKKNVQNLAMLIISKICY